MGKVIVFGEPRTQVEFEDSLPVKARSLASLDVAFQPRMIQMSVPESIAHVRKFQFRSRSSIVVLEELFSNMADTKSICDRDGYLDRISALEWINYWNSSSNGDYIYWLE